MRWRRSAHHVKSAPVLLIDTNVLMYASGPEHPLREPSVRIITLIGERRLEATSTTEAIQEFAHIFARRRGRLASRQQSMTYAALLAPLRVAEQEHLEAGLRLWADNEQLGAFDAVLAAVALDTKYATIVSADRAFASVTGLNHVFPDDDGVASLLS